MEHEKLSAEDLLQCKIKALSVAMQLHPLEKKSLPANPNTFQGLTQYQDVAPALTNVLGTADEIYNWLTKIKMNLPSQFQIGDKVLYDTGTLSFTGEVVAVKFTDKKVLCDILEDKNQNVESDRLSDYVFPITKNK